MITHYQDRIAAGKVLADALKEYSHQPDTLVLALPRGGVPVGAEIARALDIPLDVFIVRKLGVPQNDELAMGAIASGNTIVYNNEIIQRFQISPSLIEQVRQRESLELARREKAYRGDHPFPDLAHKTILLVDDGVATGATLRAAIEALRQHHHPARIIVAVPVADQAICRALALLVDQVVCPLIPEHLNAVGRWYREFSQTSDEEVSRLLARNFAKPCS